MLEIELNLKKRRTHTHTQKTGCECVSILAMIVLMWVTRIAVLIHFALRVNRPTLFFFFACFEYKEEECCRTTDFSMMMMRNTPKWSEMVADFQSTFAYYWPSFIITEEEKNVLTMAKGKNCFFFFVRWMNAHCCSFLYPAADFKSRECLPAIHTHSNGFTPIIIDRPSRVLDNSIALIPVSSFFTWNFFVVFIFLVFFVLRMTFFFWHGKCSASFSRPVRRADGTLRPSSFPLAHLIWVENRKKKKNYI